MKNQTLGTFYFPAPLLIHQKLTKKSFYEMGNLSNAQQKLLKEQVESIQLSVQLTADKTNIPVYKTDNLEYLEIFVIEVQLKSDQTWLNLSAKQLKSLHEIFHKAIPYPLVLIIHSGNKTQLSLAEKLINQANISNEKLIVSDIIQTDWISPLEPQPIEQQFLESLSYNQLNHQNLFQFYQSLIQRFTALLIGKQTGTFEFKHQAEQNSLEQLNQQRQKLKTIINLDRDIAELKNKMENCNQFNEKVEFNIQLQKLNAQLEQVKES